MSIVVPLEGFGGGAALNFKVVGGTSQPTNPRENTIWVNTSTTITDWVFSAAQPTGTSGMVWISIGTSSAVEFNALKKNELNVYPISVKQYVSGEWTDKTAKTYQNGAWHDWWDGTVIDGNNQYTEITGGWTEVLGDTGSVTWADSGVTLTYTGGVGRHASIYSKKTIDITNYKTLRATVTNSAGTVANNLIGVRKSPTTSTQITEYAAGYAAYSEVPISTSTQTINIDISKLTGAHYVQIASGIGTLKIKKLQFIT